MRTYPSVNSGSPHSRSECAACQLKLFRAYIHHISEAATAIHYSARRVHVYVCGIKRLMDLCQRAEFVVSLHKERRMRTLKMKIGFARRISQQGCIFRKECQLCARWSDGRRSERKKIDANIGEELECVMCFARLVTNGRREVGDAANRKGHGNVLTLRKTLGIARREELHCLAYPTGGRLRES